MFYISITVSSDLFNFQYQFMSDFSKFCVFQHALHFEFKWKIYLIYYLTNLLIKFIKY